MVVISYLGHYDTILHIRIVIITSYFITKLRQKFIKNCVTFFIPKCDSLLDNMSLQWNGASQKQKRDVFSVIK